MDNVFKNVIGYVLNVVCDLCMNDVVLIYGDYMVNFYIVVI